jgi:hypothetical protein
MAAMGVNMAIHKDHDLHKRRAKSNILLGVVLGSFVTLVFAITMVKLKDGQMMEAFNHSLRSSLLEKTK